MSSCRGRRRIYVFTTRHRPVCTQNGHTWTTDVWTQLLKLLVVKINGVFFNSWKQDSYYDACMRLCTALQTDLEQDLHFFRLLNVVCRHLVGPLRRRSVRRDASTCRGRAQTYIRVPRAIRTHVSSFRTVADSNLLTRALLGYCCLRHLLEGWEVLHFVHTVYFYGLYYF
jgi:hypothetical protein